MAVLKTGVIEIYRQDNTLCRNIEVGNQRVSYFKWLEDRNLALLAVAFDTPGGKTRVSLTRIDPEGEGEELSADIENLPAGSTMVDVAYSTATNAIYMQVQTSKIPENYKVYRTDANHNLQPSFLTTTRISRIATLFSLDYLIYDDLTDGTIIAKFTDGSWSVISPVAGKYRLVGTEANTIYIARINTAGLATAIYKGGVKTKFEEYKTLPVPVEVQQLTVKEAAKPPVH
jgi:hypothetical protein